MNRDKILKELRFKTALSGGPGGQHVNKTETKVILEWELMKTEACSEEELQKIKLKLKNYISKEEIFQLNCAKTRSQHKNKSIVIERFVLLIEESLRSPKNRKPTQASKASKLKRLAKKKRNAEIKKNRKNPLL